MIRKILMIAGLLTVAVNAATVSGEVTDAVSKEVLAGAKIVLHEVTWVDGEWQTGDAVRDTVSAKDGSYSFENVGSGWHRMIASLKDYQESQQTFRVRDRDRELTRNIEMSLMEFGAIEGVVIDADSKEPVAGAMVRLHKPGSGVPVLPGSVDSTKTGLDGSYSFAKVETGMYVIRAAADDYVQVTSNVFNLESEETQTVDLQLTPYVPPSGGIEGVVTNAETKDAIKGIMIVLHRTTLVGGGRLIWTELDSVTTDKEGKYSFSELAPLPMQSMYRITVRHNLYEDFTSDGIRMGDEIITLDIELQPEPMGTMHVFVGKSELYEAPPSAKSRIRNAEVAVTRPEGESTLFSGITDDDGWVVFKNVPEGTYWVYAEKEISRIENRVTTRVGDDEMDTAIVLLDPILRGTLNVFVGRGVERSGKPVESPIGGVVVSAAHETEDGILYTGLTDEEGWVSFPGAVIGDYTLTANKTKAGWAVKTQERKLDENENDTAYILLDLIDPESKILMGTVLNQENDDPIEGAEVTLQASQGGSLLTLIGSTGKEGVFKIQGIPAEYVSGTIIVTASGMLGLQQNVRLDGDTTNVELKMEEDPISVEKTFKSRSPYIYTSGTQLFIGGYEEKAVMGIYSIKGRLIQRMVLSAGQNILELPEVVSNSVLFVKITGPKSNTVKRVMVP